MESDLQQEGYKLNRNNDLKTAVVDFMCMIRKVPFHVHKNINKSSEPTWAVVSFSGVINQIHAAYNSYLQNSIQESERAHRSNTIPTDIVDLGLKSVIPVDLKLFWSLASNKHQLSFLLEIFPKQIHFWAK